MKRSEINTILREGVEFFREHGFYLPPFAYWSPSDWQKKDETAREIVTQQLGWHLTDYGMNDFKRHGLLTLTMRRGAPENLATCSGKLYAEKIMLVGVDQVNPLQMHHNTTLDLIHRGGKGNLLIQLFNASETETLAQDAVQLTVDGVQCSVSAGGMLTLHGGESVTLRPRTYYRFWAEEQPIMVGAISTAHDSSDTCFYETAQTPALTIEENEPPVYLLVTDYTQYYKPELNSPEAINAPGMAAHETMPAAPSPDR
ncbi:MAG TPA: D-lyxose/D-mannose family sugar isomerase [Anaerolineae bacterium]|nr:D-lyxose/D-mannose family sugar isomerase [Anaerolineae bacterium]